MVIIMKIRKMNVFIISVLLIFGSFSNVNALSLNQEQSNETEHLEITPYAFSQKTYKCLLLVKYRQIKHMLLIIGNLK